MSSFIPPLRPDEIHVDQLDVLGHRERGHLSHVGFAWEGTEVSRGDEISVIDARPVRRSNERIAVHAIGRLELSRHERALMTTWLERRARSRPLSGDHLTRSNLGSNLGSSLGSSSGHNLGPGHGEVERDVRSGRILGRPQSCAGLVYECLYRCAGIALVDLDALPPTSRERLVQLWGEKVVQMAEYRDDLVGDGPWAVLLPAHILHALARTNPRAEPLRPTPAQWDFP